VRLPGLVADQEVLFGLTGQTLSVSHRTTGREAFAPGVLLAVRRLVGAPRFYRGLDQLLGLM
jgi:4-hydroxy-tetrahydrodipicolinate reductase